MSVDEALIIIEEFQLEFDIENTAFGDGSKSITHRRVFDSKEDAERYIEALYTVIEHVGGEL